MTKDERQTLRTALRRYYDYEPQNLSDAGTAGQALADDLYPLAWPDPCEGPESEPAPKTGTLERIEDILINLMDLAVGSENQAYVQQQGAAYVGTAIAARKENK